LFGHCFYIGLNGGESSFDPELQVVKMNNTGIQGLVFILLAFLSLRVEAEFRGEAETRFDYYPHTPLFSDQSEENLEPSFALDLEWQESLGQEFATRVSLFGRYNPNAERDLSGDVREAWLAYYGEQSEWLVGVLMERWGVLEAENILDILNPRDAVEDFQGDVKLGVPGFKTSYLGEALQLDVWLLPYSRERRLAEGKDHYRISSLPFRQAEFEDGQNQLSIAARAYKVKGNLEVAVSHFHGHARTPWFKLETDVYGRPTGLQPRYDLIDQTGLQMLWVAGQSLWKLETLYNQGMADDFLAVGVGVERVMPRILDTRFSLTLYAEGYYDARDETQNLPVAPFQRDIFLGARLAMNDVESTEYQLRVTHDLEYASTLLDIRASRRLDADWSMQASLYAFFNIDEDPALTNFSEDNRIQFNLIRNF
jgi:hypothetical protein